MPKHFTISDLRNTAAAKHNPQLLGETRHSNKSEEVKPTLPQSVNLAMQIKPMSVNDAWKGQRFRSNEYKAYAKRVLDALPELTIPAPPYRVFFEFGLSNEGSDFDNPIKPLTDLLQKKYGFNDKDIVEAHIKKVVVSPYEEYFTVMIETIKEV